MWMSTSGADLLRTLPPGVNVVLDPYERHAVAIPHPDDLVRWSSGILL